MPSQSRFEDYSRAAVQSALVDPLGDGTFVARVAGLTGVIAFGETEEAARAELGSMVEDWARFQRQRGIALPMVGGVDLNDDTAPSILTG